SSFPIVLLFRPSTLSRPVHHVLLLSALANHPYLHSFPTRRSSDLTYDTLRNFIFKTYLDNLADYYNDENDDVLSILEGNALDKIQANKASGNFADHQNYPGTTVSVQQISEREYQITVNRTYSHATSNGQETSQVTYTVLDTNGMLKITNYE